MSQPRTSTSSTKSSVVTASKWVTFAASVGLGIFVARKYYSKRKVIAVDMDEVLCQFLGCLTSYIQKNYNNEESKIPLNKWISSEIISDLEPTKYVSYLFHETWKCTFNQATMIVQDFLDSSYFNNTSDITIQYPPLNRRPRSKKSKL